MESKKFTALLNSIHNQLDAEHLDYVIVVVNHDGDKPAEGIVGINTHKGLGPVADILFTAAKAGESAPQHFIEHIIRNVFGSISEHISRRFKQRPVPKNIDVNLN